MQNTLCRTLRQRNPRDLIKMIQRYTDDTLFIPVQRCEVDRGVQRENLLVEELFREDQWLLVEVYAVELLLLLVNRVCGHCLHSLSVVMLAFKSP